MTDAERIKKLDEAWAEEAWRIYMFHHNEPPKAENEHRVPATIAARLAREATAARIKELEARVMELEKQLSSTKNQGEV